MDNEVINFKNVEGVYVEAKFINSFLARSILCFLMSITYMFISIFIFAFLSLILKTYNIELINICNYISFPLFINCIYKSTMFNKNLRFYDFKETFKNFTVLSFSFGMLIASVLFPIVLYMFKTFIFSFVFTILFFSITAIYGYFYADDNFFSHKNFVYLTSTIFVMIFFEYFLSFSNYNIFVTSIMILLFNLFMIFVIKDLKKKAVEIYLEGNENDLNKLSIIGGWSLYLIFIDILIRVIRIFAVFSERKD